ncbi:MAG: hypothetical protein ACRD13_13345, partial [Terriglobales bacterium]
MKDQAATVPAAAAKRRKPPKIRGLYEKRPGSGVWWVRFTDCAGREHREKAGTRTMAIDLLAKRRGERLRGEKLPESLRRKALPVRELLDLAAAHVRAHYKTQRICAGTGAVRTDYRYPVLVAALGD